MPPRSPRILVIDEFHAAFGGDDALRREVRDVEGVPKTLYLVRGDRIFVFDKLVALVKALPPVTGPDRAAAIFALVEEAFISPIAAVRDWGIVPRPYHVLVAAGGGFRIGHRPFDALLPGVFLEREALENALVRLLLGGTLPGDGDFVYRGQAFEAGSGFDLAALPSVPDIGDRGPGIDHPDLDLGGTAFLPGAPYREGFPLVSRAMFDVVAAAHCGWRWVERRALTSVGAREGYPGLALDAFPLARLNDLLAGSPGVDLDDIRDTRAAFPALAPLTDAVFGQLLTNYENSCLLGHNIAGADNGFLFFVLGVLASGGTITGHAAIEVGLMTVFSVLRGNAAAAAMEVGLACRAYSHALYGLVAGISLAMDFLGQDEARSELCGERVTTFHDFMRRGQKSRRTLSASQQTTGFPAS